MKTSLAAGLLAASLLVALPLAQADAQSGAQTRGAKGASAAAPPSAAAAPAPDSAATQPPPSDGQLAAARELLQTMDAEHVMIGAAIASIHTQGANNPFLAPYQDVLESWARKYLTWDAVGPEMIRLYASSFTEPELRELTAFYRTPVGRKSLTVMPELMERGGQIGAEIGRAHTPDLVQMIEARQKELQQFQPKSSPPDSSRRNPSPTDTTRGRPGASTP